MSNQAYPLSWPQGQPRTPRPQNSRFDTTFTRARNALIDELRLIGANQPVLSTNIELRLDGQPYASRRMPDDTGIAVYFKWKGRPMVFACDKWNDCACNLQSIVKTINAIRGIERWGSSDMMERAFTGFAALPAPQTGQEPWYFILNLPPTATAQDIKTAARKLLKIHHPDHGGDVNKAAAINDAKRQALKEVA